MGIVYKATEVKTGRPVAIKTILPQVVADSYKVKLFQRELHVVSQLKHKHIVRVFGYGKAKAIFYVIFEYVDGMDLAKFIQSQGGRVAIDEAAPILLDVLDGLAYAHRAKVTSQTAKGKQQIFQGIVHRDLKPENILLTRGENRWTPKIADFGFAKSFESAGLTNITEPGCVVGTPMY